MNDEPLQEKTIGIFPTPEGHHIFRCGFKEVYIHKCRLTFELPSGKSMSFPLGGPEFEWDMGLIPAGEVIGIMKALEQENQRRAPQVQIQKPIPSDDERRTDDGDQRSDDT